MSLENKVVIIMGASSGIGEATVDLLNKKGAKLVISARRIEKLEQIKKGSAYPENILVKVADVTKPEEVNAVVTASIKKFGKVDAIYNNAGVMPLANLSDGKHDDWQSMVDINIMGVLNGISAVLPVFHEQGYGQVIATDSVAGHVVAPEAVVYSGTKFAVRGIMDGLRMEEATRNIKSTMISPGDTETPLIDQSNPNRDSVFGNVKKLLPKNIAEAVAFAIDTENNMAVSEIIIRPTQQSY